MSQNVCGSHGKELKTLFFVSVEGQSKCCGLNLVWVQNFENWFNFYFLLSCIHYHNLKQWQIKLKPVQKTLNQG